MPSYEKSALEITIKFNAGLDADKNATKIAYNATIVFSDLEDAVKCGARFVTWNLQRMARAGELPQGRPIRVNSKGEFEKTDAEVVASLTPEQMDAVLRSRGIDPVTMQPFTETSA